MTTSMENCLESQQDNNKAKFIQAETEAEQCVMVMLSWQKLEKIMSAKLL